MSLTKQRFFILAIALLFHTTTNAQFSIYKIRQITDSATLAPSSKIKILRQFKKDADARHMAQDSAYAFLLQKLGVLEFRQARNFQTGIEYISQAANINLSGKKNTSIASAITSYYSLGYFYDQLNLFNRSLICYDSTIDLVKKYDPANKILFDSRLNKAYIYFRKTDYQQAVSESIIGLKDCSKEKDVDYYIGFLNQKAQALFFQNDLSQALSAVNEIILIAGPLKLHYDIASALKIKGFILQKERQFATAEKALRESISERLQSNDNAQIAADYIDLGGLFLDSMRLYPKATSCFLTAIEYANKGGDSARMARASLRAGSAYLQQHQYNDAAVRLSMAWNYLKIKNADTSISYFPTAIQLQSINNKDLSFGIIAEKSRLLLQLFKENGNKKLLDVCLQLNIIADSVISQIRHEQYGEKSKLFWRNETRNFYAMALEVCWLTNNNTQAYFFMERSRAVLLADKLNELGASATLPPGEAMTEQILQTNIVNQQTVLRELDNPSPAYSREEVALVEMLNQQQAFVHSLEKKYPAYYQYKYADAFVSLQNLQSFLQSQTQSFVYYFLADTTGYILTITNRKTRLFRLPEADRIFKQINDFSLACENKQELNSNYDLFSRLSFQLYQSLFQLLELPAGKVIVCADNFLIPFEALCSDTNGKNYLLYNYVFSYAYSATYLLKPFVSHPVKGNFAGFAPVTFQSYLEVPDLKKSALFLQSTADFYNSHALFTNDKATKDRFIHTINSYQVVNVFSHARADTLNPEPVLFMQDSVVHLAELQLIRKPATQLIVLSACQTNVGKNATGEGIFSLARGFSAAGIPSAAATLWKADEQSIYLISQKFNEFISKGMNKDDALQKAKLFFLETTEGDKHLPYYWANMVLIGNAQPVMLSVSGHLYWLWITIAFAILALVGFLIFRIMISATVQSSG